MLGRHSADTCICFLTAFSLVCAACEGKLFPNTAIPGNNFEVLPAASPAHCQALCSTHPKCTYFSYARSVCVCQFASLFLWTASNEKAVIVMWSVAFFSVVSSVVTWRAIQMKWWWQLKKDSHQGYLHTTASWIPVCVTIYIFALSFSPLFVVP